MLMRKAVTEYPLRIIVSVLVIGFIVTIGYYEIETFSNNRDLQIFASDISTLLSSVSYLKDSNSIGSFEQVLLRLPDNQTVTFNNITDRLELAGYYTEEYSLNADMLTNLSLTRKGEYTLTLCYDCIIDKSYLVKFR